LSANTESGLRRVSGKKGLGKLALFGIGKTVEVATSRAGSADGTVVHLDYDEMMEAQGEYRPREEHVDIDTSKHGTAVRLSALKRTSSIDPEALATSLARLFNYFGVGFDVRVVGVDGTEYPITPSLRLEAVDVEFTWAFPDSWLPVDEYGSGHSLEGTVVASRVPLRHGMRGITLYVNGRLANEPEFFGSSESSFAFSYLTGYLNVDFLDGLEPDVIATDRRTIDWDTDETALLQGQLQTLMVRLGQEWRAKRRESRRLKGKVDPATSPWLDSIRSPEQQPVRQLVEVIESEDIDMTDVQQGRLLGLVRQVAPPNAEYVWRHLHPEILDATKSYYVDGNYYLAVQEALKRYVNLCRKGSSVPASQTDFSLMGAAFGQMGKLRVFKRFVDSHHFAASTESSVEDGQKHMSMGMVAGFRNPLAHEEISALQASGAFTNEDCLDALGIISHLMKRLEGAKLR
jgi:uncharacterized protein (TIGR02391 family)